MADYVDPVQRMRNNGIDPAEARRYLSGACLGDNCGECTDRVCEHDCGHEGGEPNA